MDSCVQVPPLARGCPHGQSPYSGVVNGSPACAGMSLEIRWRFCGLARFPRLRGDVPAAQWSSWSVGAVPPLARGCPRHPDQLRRPAPGSPACAGMSPVKSKLGHNQLRFPRLRGDVPIIQRVTPPVVMVPPLARGCPRKVGSRAITLSGSPACAGMSRAPRCRRTRRRWFPRLRGDVPYSDVLILYTPSVPPLARGCPH